MLQPPTTVIDVENTHNRAGGVVWTVAEALSITAVARDLEIATFLDGARLWNAAAALEVPIAELARPFDVVNVAFSKGLGAPGGSTLAGSRAFIDSAIRYRRMAGGAMRQVGVFAAAADHALDHHLERLVEDHANARLLADRLAESPAFEIDPAAVQTNILVFRTADEAPDAPTVVALARDAGVLVVAFNARTIRAVTHLDVSRDEVAEAAERLVAVAESALPV
jgi:threonine aldolase